MKFKKYEQVINFKNKINKEIDDVMLKYIKNKIHDDSDCENDKDSICLTSDKLN